MAVVFVCAPCVEGLHMHADANCDRKNLDMKCECLVRMTNPKMLIDAAGTEISESDMEEKVRQTLGELGSWELIDIIEQYVPLWELEDLAKDDNGNWWE